jgi:hypothetical protein
MSMSLKPATDTSSGTRRPASWTARSTPTAIMSLVQYADWGGANQQWQLVPGDGPSQGTLPASFQWSSSGVLAGPRPDAGHPNAVAIKDFSVVRTTTSG